MVVDFTETDLTVATGIDSEFTFTLDGTRGEMMEAAGTLDIDIFGFVQVEGEFVITKDTRTVQLADATDTIQSTTLAIGASNARAFAGVDGGTDEAMGFEITDGNFGLALLSDKTDPTHTGWP
ncbi:hypothetical protein HK414_16100 [Ramlibacter terrae]|uniref:Uncharacterized protein n=1 Tax=Ramlibacter terrae TaxID=2732511 RepID=A0ABX6P4M2_9BURK|nr:hypothetical protein HK414_16100 [Ramlibacter terrae]